MKRAGEGIVPQPRFDQVTRAAARMERDARGADGTQARQGAPAQSSNNSDRQPAIAQLSAAN